MGDARGHWEHDTLVVETTRFRDRSMYQERERGNDAPRRALRAHRRRRLEWTVTVDDPATWTKPWTFSMPLTMNDGEAVLEFACHEGNYAVPHILSGARATERGAVDAAAGQGVNSK